HWGFDGTPDNWVSRSFLRVFGILLAGAVISLVVILSTRRGGFHAALAINGIISILLCYFASRPLWARFEQLGYEFLLILAAMVAIGIAVTVKILSADESAREHWKWGLFYYNPDDPALVVDKRIGLGWTLNFANRWSWAVMIAMVALAAGAMVLV
ncbi:MAG: DUF5808 domain-containing protein, partial [Bryobacteraceae bacterium]